MYTLEVQNLRQLRVRGWSGVGSNVFFLGATSMLTDISSEMVTAILPVYMAFALHLTPLQLGLVDGLQHGATAFSRIAGAWVADRWRRDKEVAAVGYLVSALCKIGLLGATSWATLANVIALDRLGKGIRTSPRDALISFSSSPEHRGLAFGVHRAMDTVGALAGPLLAFAILWQLPAAYDVIFVTSFFIALVAVSVLMLFVRNVRLGGALRPRRSSFPAVLVELLAQPRFKRIVLGAVCVSLATIGDAFFYLALQQGTSASLALFPLFFVVTAVVYMVMSVPIGHLGDRIGRGKVFLLGHVLLLLGCACLLSLDAGHSFGVLALMMLGGYYACTDGVLMAAASGLVPESMRATGLGVLTTAIAISRLLASVAFGVMWSAIGLQFTILVFIAGLLIAMIFTLKVWLRLESVA
jgi:MFS family permease